MSKNKLTALIEDTNKKIYQTYKEKITKKQLIKLLRKNGHPKYADRLEKFYVKIIPLSVDPNCTAYINTEHGYIGISEGFLNDPATFFQLDVLMRHELSHALMMHQIRMMHKMGDKFDLDYKTSATIQEMLNVIMDFEISNKRYSNEDKELIRHLKLNGEEISGLVTEDLRKDWKTLTVEEMYDKISKEINDVNKEILANRGSLNKDQADKLDFVNHYGVDLSNIYGISSQIANDPSRLTGPLQDFIDGKAVILGNPAVFNGSYISYDNAPEVFQKIFDGLNKLTLNEDSVYNENYSNVTDEANAVIEEIQASDPLSPYTIKQKLATGKNSVDKSVILVTPEEKWIGIEIFKYIAGNTSSNPEDFNLDAPGPTINVKGVQKSDEYLNVLNKIIDAYNNGDCTLKDLEDFIGSK